MEKSDNNPSLRRQCGVAWRMLRTAWHIRPGAVCGYFVGAALEIGGTLLTIYATA